jgi:hypothetical protein
MTFVRRLRIVACAAVVVLSGIASGQVLQAGDRDPSGRVLTKIVVTLTDASSFGHPVSGLRFLVVTETGDRVSIRTDDAGVAATWIFPGSYRFVTPEPLVYDGNSYTWDFVMPIRAGTPVIKVSQANASKIEESTPGVIPVERTQAGAPSDLRAGTSPLVREGFWFNMGLGYGVLGCKNCDGTINGLTGGLVFGGTLTPRFLLGVGTTGWTKSEGGATLTVGTLDARLRFYPSATGNFFLTGGVGAGTISGEVVGFGSASETGVGIVLGLGYDLRLGQSASITPFWNGFAIQTSNADANVGQLGLGLTFH